MTAGPALNTAGADPVADAVANGDTARRLRGVARAALRRDLDGASDARLNAEAERIVAEACTRALTKWSDYDPTRNVVNWLVGFVVRVAREFVKGERRAPAAGIELESLAADVGLPGDALVREEERAQLGTAVAQLTDAERAMLLLVYEDGLTFAEVGERLGIRTDAARTRHCRIIARLRHLLDAPEGGHP
jgi:RNA polymerase sigma factor (sigma-70 family)